MWSYRIKSLFIIVTLLALQTLTAIWFSNWNSNMALEGGWKRAHFVFEKDPGGLRKTWPAQRRSSLVRNPKAPAKDCAAVLLTRMSNAFFSWVHNLPTGKLFTISRFLLVISLLLWFPISLTIDVKSIRVFILVLKSPKLTNKYSVLYIWCQIWGLILNQKLKRHQFF